MRAGRRYLIGCLAAAAAIAGLLVTNAAAATTVSRTAYDPGTGAGPITRITSDDLRQNLVVEAIPGTDNAHQRITDESGGPVEPAGPDCVQLSPSSVECDLSTTIEVTLAGGDDVVDLPLDGGYADSVVDGGAGDDRLAAGWGADAVDGGPGRDVISDGTYPYQLPQHVDAFDGGAGADVIRGGNWIDRLLGGPGPDRLLAGAGDDLLVGGPGADLLHGLSGDDELHSEDEQRDYALKCGTGRDYLFLDRADAGLGVSCETEATVHDG